jgi:hypothetical protein
MTRKNNRRKPLTWSIYETIVHSSVYEEWDTQVTHYATIGHDMPPIMHVYEGDLLKYRVLRVNCGDFYHPNDAMAALEMIAKNNDKTIMDYDGITKVIFA